MFIGIKLFNNPNSEKFILHLVGIDKTSLCKNKSKKYSFISFEKLEDVKCQECLKLHEARIAQ